MALFQSAKDLPELAGLDAAEQKRIYKQTAKEAQKALGAKLIPPVLIILAVYFILVFFSGLSLIVQSIICSLTFFSVMLLLVRPMLIKKIRELLQAQGYPK